LKYSREYLEHLAGTTGFRPDTLEKVLRLERLLTQVTRHPFLGSRLLLKGGTALNLFFFAGVPRLSVDLDFNYVGAVDREAMLLDRPDVERAVEQLAAGDGYRVQKSVEEHAGRKFFLGYRNGLGTQDRIEVDLNYMFRIPLMPGDLRPAWTPDSDVPCQARLAAFEEVMAGKLLALVDRTAARDVYDVASFCSDPPTYHPGLLRSLFISLSGILPRALTAYGLQLLDAFSWRELESQLAPFLRQGERPEMETLKTRVAVLLSDLLSLTGDEQAYVERLQRGEFSPELVTHDHRDLLPRLRSHPALLWKVQNAQKRPSGS